MGMAKALDKKRLMREIEHDRRRMMTQRLRELRALIRAARAVRRESLARIRLQCRTARVKLRQVCATRAERAKREGEQAIKARALELAEEKSADRLHRSTDARHRAGVVRVGETSRSKARERAGESDDVVRQDIPAALVPVFDKVRRRIKATDRKSRTEAFLHWAEENPSEVYAIQEHEAEREIRKMVAEHNRGARALELQEVPF